MKEIIKSLIPYALISVLAMTTIGFFTGDVVFASVSQIEGGVDSISGDAPDVTLTEVIRIIINTVLFLVGVVSVIMIILGGFRYVVSNGDSGAMSAAKNTILYAVVGLVIAIAAFAIVNFVIDTFANTNAEALS